MSNIKRYLDADDIIAIDKIISEYRSNLDDLLGEEHIKTGLYIDFLRLVNKSLGVDEKLVSDGITTKVE